MGSLNIGGGRLQCYTQEEIAAAVGMPHQTVSDLLPDIRKYKIPAIPGIFSEDLPDDSAPQRVKDKAEKERAEKIVQDNKANAEHEQDFEIPERYIRVIRGGDTF